ncbi:hypothetical protein BS17DRAFT_730527 [Gyrodon lividus]|nr:hypothetical protein BS17DRAFT_730527 [Gyrodon lividus]
MHKALCVQEILSNIFDRVCTDLDDPEWQPNLNPSLAALARTCRTFQEPAVDALWFQLDDLTPLLRCLPQDVWVLFATVQTSQQRTEVFGLRRPLNESEWGILQGYTRRIRVVASVTSSTGQLEQTAVRALCYPPMTTPLFPNLRQIQWNDMSPETFPFIRRLAGPKVTNLVIKNLASWGSAELSVLGSLRHLCPNVKDVQIFTPQLNDTLSTDIVSELLCSWANLRSVKCRSINGNAFLHLASMDTLEVLGFTFDRRSFKHILGTSIIQFPSLRRLFVTPLALPSMSKIMRQLRVSIEVLGVSFGGWPTNQHIRSFLTTLQESCAHDPMHCIDLRQLDLSDQAAVDPQTYTLTFEDLFPLACFSNLTSVTLDTGYFVYLEDDDMLSLGASWPNIRQLSINEQRGWGTSSGLTPRGLVRLLQKCKLLQNLCVVIDTRDFSSIPLDRPSYGSVVNSTCINVLDSVIDPQSATALAAFLSDVYPLLETITAWDTPAMSNRPEAARYKKLWTKVQVLATKISMVRRQERRWNSGTHPHVNHWLGPDSSGSDSDGVLGSR